MSIFLLFLFYEYHGRNWFHGNRTCNSGQRIGSGMVSVDTYIPCTIWQGDRCLCSVWIEDHKNAVGRFTIHAAVDPECKHIFVETVHGSDVCVDISCIGKAKRRMGFAEGDQSLVIVINILISLIF